MSGKFNRLLNNNDYSDDDHKTLDNDLKEELDCVL